ncbi:MAG TPA: hypothetical protein VJZ03_05010, partial [Candidatus Bathyarchaeia archaeon]|nr:hypothetical protein [Candidatus Bathyarchaeia archaeon]
TAPIAATIEQNIFQGIPSGMRVYIINLLAGSGKFINNTIYANGNKTIYVNDPAWTSSPNTIIP